MYHQEKTLIFMLQKLDEYVFRGFCGCDSITYESVNLILKLYVNVFNLYNINLFQKFTF